MTDIKLQKGNLFNPLTGYFDFDLVNSSEYDLEVSIDGNKEYYRIRFKDFDYVVTKLKNSDNYEFIKPCSLTPSPKDEVLEFFNSEYYKKEFKNRFKTDNFIRENRTRKYSTDASYSNYFASLFQKSKFNSTSVCSFYVDSKNYCDRKNVEGYKVDIELVRNRYYIVFVEAVGRGLRKNNEPMWFIYDRKDFKREKDYFIEDVLTLVDNDKYPLLLTESLMLLAGSNQEKTKNILCQLEKYKEYFKASNIKEFLKRDFEKEDISSEKNSLIKILTLTNYQEIKFALEHNNNFRRELIDFILNDKDDIENSVVEAKKVKKL